LRFFAQMLKPVATAAPMDKYRKPAGIGPTVFVAETKVQAEEHKAERKAERKMLDANRAEPAAAVLVRPLPAVQQREKRIRKSAMPRIMRDSIDSDYIGLTSFARANSNLLDLLAAQTSMLREREFQNESEDDESEYAIRR